MAYGSEASELQSMENVEEPRCSLFQTPAHAWRSSAADFLSVQRMEMQSRLPLLLVLRQQREGHDRADSKAVHRLAPRRRQSLPRPDGRRTLAAAEVHPQDR